MDKSMEAFRSVEFSRNVRHQKGLDETDLKILTELRKNGRISNGRDEQEEYIEHMPPLLPCQNPSQIGKACPADSNHR